MAPIPNSLRYPMNLVSFTAVNMSFRADLELATFDLCSFSLFSSFQPNSPTYVYKALQSLHRILSSFFQLCFISRLMSHSLVPVLPLMTLEDCYSVHAQ